MQVPTIVSVWVPVLLACVVSTSALFEDQAGTYDWYKPYVGPITDAAFHRTKPRVYVATEQGVVGALNLKDGSIAFRHQHGQGQAAHAQLVEGATGAWVSAVGSQVQAWDVSDGSLKWSASLSTGKAATRDTVVRVTKGSNSVVAVLGSGVLTVYDASNGDKSSSVQLSEAARAGTAAHLHASSDEDATAYTFTPGQSTVYVITLTGETALEAPAALSAVAAAGPAGLFVLSSDYQQACVAAPSSSIQCTPLSQLWSSTGSVNVQVVATSTGWAIASGNPGQPGVALVSVSDNGALSVTAKFDSASAVSQPLAAGAGEVVAAVTVSTDGSVNIDYVLTSTGKVIASESSIRGARTDRLAPGVTAPGVRAAVVGTYKKRDQSEGYRSLLVWQDERISLVQQGVTVWSRDEALGGVTTAMFSDLPPGKEAAAGVAAQVGGASAGSEDWKEKLGEFARLQLLNAKVQFKLASREEVAELFKMREMLSDKNLPTRDARGFRRALVVATSSGKIAALHNGDGRVLWSRPGPAGRQGRNAAPEHLLPWRTYHDLQHAPQVATLAAGADGRSTLLSVLDVYTGREIEAATLPYTITKSVRLGHVADGETAEQQLYLAVTASAGGATPPTVHLLPDTPLARSHFVTHHRSLYFFLDGAVVGPDAAFKGFGFDSAAAEQAQRGGPISAVSAWSVAFPSPVLTWTAVDPSEPVHTSVKVLGDRSMKYRYLNPNTLVVVTGTPAGAAGRSEDVIDSSATIYVIDTVTGGVRHTQTAPSCGGPAVATVTENTVVVQLWNAASARFTLTSMELFDASERTFSVLDHMFNPNATAPQSSFDPPPLEVPSLAFFTRTPAKAMITTRTRAGITSKMLIQLTETDQVYAVDMRFLDPRRPHTTKLTPEQQEERLIPYADTIPLMPVSFLSYNKQVLGVKHAISEASRLESTTLLFSYGVDLQYTRLAPAKNFDSLDDDFSYGLLIVALIALLLGSAFMHVYTKKSMLKTAWQ